MIMTQTSSSSPSSSYTIALLLLLPLWLHVSMASAMTLSRKLGLREEARAMFRHGWESYWEVAFPEDEVKPLTCVPHHRDRANPKDTGSNDALGEFSLTAIDTLSTMAVMAASSEVEAQRFWEVADELARIYWYNVPKEHSGGGEGDDRSRASSWGRFQGRKRSTRGFDIDAKVQVFETTIRGLGGLLSAHLFAVKRLPGLPKPFQPKVVYKNELLLLAEDLGRRLLPALTLSPTGIPYPRINLRHGLPHAIKNPRYYYNRVLGSPQYRPGTQPEHPSEKFWRHPPSNSVKRERPDDEVTETCTAGAGSLVLEFTALSRLTGDPVFEAAAKKAFDSIWIRRSRIGLVGMGVDAESGQWVGENSGVGAGVDSFFEYAFKSYVLFAGNAEESYFLDVWEQARAALERHVLVREPATWWNNVNFKTGAGIQGGSWIDSLGGFFAGVLSQAGGTSQEDDALDLAVSGNMVYSALWNRYNALPERFNTRTATIEGTLSWYPGRPELAESTYLLYRTTKDPFWLHVGEMVMRDLKRRCRARCGWAGLQDVRTGKQQNRMESFWLSETWKYLFLLFDEDNPLHKLDAPWVFTTEGHPLILPRPTAANLSSSPSPRTCARPPDSTSFFSTTASRPDLFHAAYFAQLDLSTTPDATPSSSDPNALYSSPSNSTFYPYTLPLHLVPPNATCAPIPARNALELLFPDGFSAPNAPTLQKGGQKLQRVAGGIRILSLDALQLSLIEVSNEESVRILKVSGIMLGKEETVFVHRALVEGIVEEEFEVVVETGVVELVVGSGGGGGGGGGWWWKKEEEKGMAVVVAKVVGGHRVGTLGRGQVVVVGKEACDGPLPRSAEVVVLVKEGTCGVARKVGNMMVGGRVRLVVVEGVEVEEVRDVGRKGVAVVVVEEGVGWAKAGKVQVRERVGVWVLGMEVVGLVVD